MPRTRINGVTMHYQQGGEGPDVVMVHGLGSSLAFWHLSVLPYLACRYRVTMYDLRGHGLSDMPPSGYTFKDLAGDLMALVDALRIERAHVVGHSFGAAIAIEMAVLAPQRIRSLVLADARLPVFEGPLPSRESPYWRRLRRKLQRLGMQVPPDVPRVAYPWLEEVARLRRSRSARALRRALPNSLALQSARWRRLMTTTTAGRDFENAAEPTASEIRSVAAPALATVGQWSPCKRTLRGLGTTLPSCRTAVIRRSGHCHPAVRPRTFVTHVDRFVQAHEAAEGTRATASRE